MKTKRLEAAIWALGTIFLPITIVLSIFKFSILTLFHFGIFTRKLFILLLGEYTIAIG